MKKLLLVIAVLLALGSTSFSQTNTNAPMPFTNLCTYVEMKINTAVKEKTPGIYIELKEYSSPVIRDLVYYLNNKGYGAANATNGIAVDLQEVIKAEEAKVKVKVSHELSGFYYFVGAMFLFLVIII